MTFASNAQIAAVQELRRTEVEVMGEDFTIGICARARWSVVRVMWVELLDHALPEGDDSYSTPGCDTISLLLRLWAQEWRPANHA